MNAEWWEGPVRFINDYWWVFLLIIVLGVTAYFTRASWLPLLGF